MKTGFLYLFGLIAMLYAGENQIVYLFAGHSNMENFYARGGEVAFIKTMKTLYPKYEFNTIRCAFASTKPVEMCKGESRFDNFISRIEEARRKSVIGGLVLMYGFIEGKDSVEALTFSVNMRRLIADIRVAARNDTLPVFINRYEKNNHHDPATSPYTKWSNKIDSATNRLPNLDAFCYLCPIRYIDGSEFSEDHHYNADGQWIFAVQLATIIQINNLDWWGR